MSWNDLSIKDKASYIRMGVKNGITDLDTIREAYNKFAEGGPIKKSYKDFSTRLSKAWNNDDLSRHYYDYQKYYNDAPEEAYRQLESIEHGGKGHFPDGGKSGTYKTPNHPTYPDLGSNSWLNNDRIFNISARQANQGLDNTRDEINTDRVLDYLGSDLNYNRGATKVMYDGTYQLPSVTVTPNGNYTELVPNELNTGWMYSDRTGRFNDFNYDYVNYYKRNQKALGGYLDNLEDTTNDNNTPKRKITYNSHGIPILNPYTEQELNILSTQNKAKRELERQKYLQSEEGKRKKIKIQKEQETFFNPSSKIHNKKYTGLDKAKTLIQSINPEIDSAQLGKDIKQAQQKAEQERIDKWVPYKRGIQALTTVAELGLSGTSLLGAYANYKKWTTSTNVAKKTLANLLQKAQTPAQLGGTLIDGYQTYQGIQDNNKFDTYYNGVSAGLGTFGTLGASDVFLNSRFHSPKIDRFLDVSGIMQNIGDFAKYGVETFNNKHNNNK